MRPKFERLLRQKEEWSPKPDGESDHMVMNIGEVQWELVTVIHQFPALLQGECSANFLFSKNFEYMLDIDYKNYSFLISKLRKNVLSYKHRDQDMPEVVTSGSHSHFDFAIDRNLLSVEFTNQFTTTECIAM